MLSEIDGDGRGFDSGPLALSGCYPNEFGEEDLYNNVRGIKEVE